MLGRFQQVKLETSRSKYASVVRLHNLWHLTILHLVGPSLGPRLQDQICQDAAQRTAKMMHLTCLQYLGIPIGRYTPLSFRQISFTRRA